MIEIRKEVYVNINGYSDEDVRDQVKTYFGLVEPQVQEVQESSTYKGYHTTKINLVKMLRKFDLDFFGRYNHDTGQMDTNVKLMELKKFVEDYMGEPDKDIQDPYYN